MLETPELSPYEMMSVSDGQVILLTLLTLLTLSPRLARLPWCCLPSLSKISLPDADLDDQRHPEAPLARLRVRYAKLCNVMLCYVMWLTNDILIHHLRSSEYVLLCFLSRYVM